ncbi:hypothetical protein GCM10020331_030470 [Ectobacillus funiculus]
MKRLKKLDFLVVSDFFLSETAEHADVVLPTTTWAEDEGTTTNLEGRVIRVRKVRDPLGESKPDWEIVSLIAERMGKREVLPLSNSTRNFFEEFRVASKGGPADYYGITWDRIDKEDGVFLAVSF